MGKIILVGYMASGKTTVGKLLAESTGFDCKDLDSIIEQESNLSVKEIFKQRGELFFRKLEAKILTELLSADSNMVLSLGGGTPCYGNNIDLLKQNDIITVYLKAKVDTLAKRLRSNSENRPLIFDQSGDELEEFIAKHLFERGYYYNQSTITVNTDNKNPEEIAAEIMAYSK